MIATRLSAAACASMLALLSPTSQAALISLGDGTVQDTNTKLIWLRDWNVNGLQTWSTQMAWAEALTFAGSSDWQLPSLDEYHSLTSSYGNLAQRIEFTSVQPADYWTSSVIAPGVRGYGVYPTNGSLTFAGLDVRMFAVAVRHVGSANVPEPATLALVGAALLGVLLASRRRAHHWIKKLPPSHT